MIIQLSMLARHPIYEMEWKSYHETKRRRDSEETFIQFFNISRQYIDYLVGLICINEAKSILLFVKFYSLLLKKSTLGGLNIDFVFLYRGIPNAPFEALEACVSSLISQGLSILVIAPEIQGLSERFSVKSSSLFFVDFSSFQSINTLIANSGFLEFTSKRGCEATLSTISSACLCAALDILSSQSEQLEFAKKIVFCQFGYPGGFSLFKKVIRTSCPNAKLVWHTTKYNARVFEADCEYSSGSLANGFVFMPSVFNVSPLSIRQKNCYIRNQRLSRVPDFQAILVSSISRPEKLLADFSFASMIADFLGKTSTHVKYQLYTDGTGSANSFVNAVCKINPLARSRIIIFRAFSPEDLVRQYEDIDLFLDPFPFSAGLTLFRALDLSVPVVSIVAPDQYTCSLTRKFYDLIGDSLFRSMSPFVRSKASYLERALCICGMTKNNHDELRKFISIQDLIFQEIVRESSRGMLDWIRYFKGL